MPVMRIEVWPGGDPDRSFEISRIGIDNRSGCRAVSDYGVTGVVARDTEEQVLRADALGHHRDHGWVPLACRALGELSSGKAVEAPLDDHIAELLRKGTHV